jgi:uncharacterized Tic20 family protein
MEMEIDFTSIDSFELDGHSILLKQNTSRVQVLNPLASLIWQFKKNGLKDIDIAGEMSKVFGISIEHALQDIKKIHTQWLTDFSASEEDVPPSKEPLALAKELSEWQGLESVFLSFPNCKVRVNFDSQIIAEKVKKKLSSFVDELGSSSVDFQLDIISHLTTFFIVKDGCVLDQVETESYAVQMISLHIVDMVCKYHDWLVILHAGGVCWQGSGVIFPALGGSGKTTLTAALIKDDFQYINDDVIPVIRDTEELVCLSTSLSIKSGSWTLLQSRYPELKSLEVFGDQEPRIKYLSPPLLEKAQVAVYAKHIVLPNYQAGAVAELELLSPVLALQAIIEGESLLHLPLDKQDIAALIKWIESLTCHRLTYDKLDPAVALLRQFCISNQTAN